MSFRCAAKQELLEDGEDKRRNTSGFKSE